MYLHFGYILNATQKLLPSLKENACYQIYILLFVQIKNFEKINNKLVALLAPEEEN